MLEKIMKKRNINHLLRSHKNFLNTKNLHIIIRQGTKIGENRLKNKSTIIQNHEYPNPRIERQIFNDASQVFKELATQEDNLEHQNTKVNELLQLLSKEGVVCWLINLLNMLKNSTTSR